MEKSAPNDYPILEPLRQRWSPLSFSSTPVAKETLLSLLEAARWAPSCFNDQPWRFVVGSRADDPETFDKILGTLVEANAAWAKNAPVLILAVAAGSFRHNGKPNRWGAYDLGQAVGHLTVQASALGVAMHQMGGFDPEKARVELSLPDDHDPLAVIAIGFPGKPEDLATEALQARERNSERFRIPLGQMVLSGADGWGKTSPIV